MQGCSCRPLLAPNPDWTRNTPPAHPFGELRQAGISLLGQKPERLFVGGPPVRENVRWSSCLILPWAISAPASPRPAARFTVSLIHRSSLASQKRAIWQASRNGGIKIRAVGNPGVLQPRAPIPLRLGACRADTGGRARQACKHGADRDADIFIPHGSAPRHPRRPSKPTGRLRRSSPRAALLRMPPSRRARSNM